MIKTCVCPAEGARECFLRRFHVPVFFDGRCDDPDCELCDDPYDSTSECKCGCHYLEEEEEEEEER